MSPDYALKELTIEITKKCPMECIICSSDGGKEDPHELTIQELYKIVDDAIKLGVKIISLSGGEPIESPHCMEFIQYVKERNLQLYLYTSGNVTTKTGIGPIEDDYLDKLKLLAVDKIIFSIHGHNAEIHENITKRHGSYDNLISSIKRSQNIGHNVELHFVPTLMNFYCIPKVIQLSAVLNIQKISFLRFVPQGRGAINRDKLEISGEKMVKLRKILQTANLNSKVKIRLGAPFNCFNIDNVTVCTAGIDKAIIRPDGYVFPCVSMKKILNCQEQNNVNFHSFDEIWKNSELFKITRLLLKDQLFCNQCQNFGLCKGGCLTQNIISLVDNYSDQEFCDYGVNRQFIDKSFLVEGEGVQIGTI